VKALKDPETATLRGKAGFLLSTRMFCHPR
jgi:hypothetical protein